jgi:hypothetical protein
MCDKVCRWLAIGRWCSPGPSVASNNKSDHHDTTERLLKVALNTINQSNLQNNADQHLFVLITNSHNIVTNIIFTKNGVRGGPIDYFIAATWSACTLPWRSIRVKYFDKYRHRMILIDSLVFNGVIILYTLTCKKYHTVKTVSKSNRKIVKRCSLDIPNTQIHDHIHFKVLWVIVITEDLTVTVKCRTSIKALFIYINLCLGVTLEDSLSYSYTSLAFLKKVVRQTEILIYKFLSKDVEQVTISNRITSYW